MRNIKIIDHKIVIFSTSKNLPNHNMELLVHGNEIETNFPSENILKHKEDHRFPRVCDLLYVSDFIAS